MTQEEFLTDPATAWMTSHGELPDEWIAVAWSNDRFRIHIEQSISRYVSKLGTFELADYQLSCLPRVLHRDQVVKLYESIRDGSMRLEEEWRPDFEAAFAEHVAALPEAMESDESTDRD